MEASYEEGQGTKGGAATYMDGWMDGYNTIGIHYIVRRNKITGSNSVNFLFVSTLRLCLSSRLKIGLFHTIFKDPISTDQ